MGYEDQPDAQFMAFMANPAIGNIEPLLVTMRKYSVACAGFGEQMGLSQDHNTPVSGEGEDDETDFDKLSNRDPQMVEHVRDHWEDGMDEFIETSDLEIDTSY